MTSKRSKKPTRTSDKPKLTAKTADKHTLYQLSVQEPATEVRFISRVFSKLRGRKPWTVREDFCGTALFCAEWVKSHRDRRAVGVDIDPGVVRWGIEHNLAPLGEPGDRIQILQQDVLKKVPGKYDVTVAFNFSYWIFRDRATQIAYFKNVLRSLNREGVFFLDAYGGFESQQSMEEPRKIEGGFTYVWDQAEYNPIDHSVVNHIHFEFRDGTRMRKAFTYEWRFWTLVELQELLVEAGFKHVKVYWEDSGDDGEGTGTYRPRKAAENDAAWVAYLVAEV